MGSFGESRRNGISALPDTSDLRRFGPDTSDLGLRPIGGRLRYFVPKKLGPKCPVTDYGMAANLEELRPGPSVQRSLSSANRAQAFVTVSGQ